MPLANQYWGKPKFIYANGTAYALSVFTGFAFSHSFGPIEGDPSLPPIVIKGLHGQTYQWSGSPAGDPFPRMLNPSKWDAVKINYAASMLPIGGSIFEGVAKVVNMINQFQPNTPFALGGYSQGAAVMSVVMKDHLQSYSFLRGLPNITGRLKDFKGAVMFGNPCRQTDRLWPAFNNHAGGKISVTSDNPNSNARYGGAHGCFPASWRMNNTPDSWFEFVGASADAWPLVPESMKATVVGNPLIDVVTSCGGTDGDSSLGGQMCAAAGDLLYWTGSGNIFIGLGALAPVLLTPVQINPSTVVSRFSRVMEHLEFGNVGHMGCPIAPPPGYPVNYPSSYQIALEYLDNLADKIGVASGGVSDLSSWYEVGGAGSGGGGAGSPGGGVNNYSGKTRGVNRYPSWNTVNTNYVSQRPPVRGVSRPSTGTGGMAAGGTA